jgi:hypothetical protein
VIGRSGSQKNRATNGIITSTYMPNFQFIKKEYSAFASRKIQAAKYCYFCGL